jgi:tetratricopeptide (TPR) repeat protein
MKKLILYPLLPTLLALSACAETPEEAFAKAQKEFAEHNYNAARINLTNALKAKPGDPAMLLLQARTLLALGDGEGASAALEQLYAGKAPEGELAQLAAEAALLRKNPDKALELLGTATGSEAERLRAVAALQKGDFPAAQDHFEKAVQTGGTARSFADYARFRLMSGDIAGADELAKRATEADPGAIDTLLIGAELALRHGDLQRSLALYSKAAKSYPTSLAALTGKAAVLGELGRLDEMEAAIGQAQAAAPDNKAVQFLQARLALARRDWDKVRSLIQPIESKLEPLDPLRQFYGEALLRLKQPQLAAAQLEPIVRAQPGNRDAVTLLGEAKLTAGDAAGAMAVLHPLVDQPSAGQTELALMAKAAKAAGNPDAAAYEARSKRPAPQSLGRDLADGDAAMRSGNWAGAVKSYERLLSVSDGKNPVVLNNLAYAYTMLGNYDQAIAMADRALKVAPGNASVLDTAGWAWFKSGRNIARAKQLLRQAVQAAPQNMTIRAHLAEAERAPG